MSDESGNRSGPRVSFSARVQLKVPSVEAFVEYFAQNLSTGGIFVQTGQDLEVGREVELRVIDPNGHTLFEAHAQVKWRRKASTGKVPGVGLEFIKVPNASQRIIDKIVAINPDETESGAGEDLFESVDEPPAEATPLPDAPPSPGKKAKSDDLKGVFPVLDEPWPEDDTAAGPPATAGSEPPGQAAWPPLYEPGQTDDAGIPAVSEDGPSLGDLLEQAAAGLQEVPPPPPIPKVSSAAVARPQVPPVVTSPMPRLPKIDKPPSNLVLGIDLGTTFSCAAVTRAGKPDVVLSETGYRTIPSVVTISDKGEVIVGWAAHDKLATHPRRTIYGSKRLLGRRFQSQAVQDALHYFDYEITPDMGISSVASHASEAAVLIENKIYPVEWVASRILHEILVWARDHTEENINRAVIAVPAYYNGHQRQAVIRAAKRAGLEVEQIVNEPTAAALAYGIDRGLHQTIMVYDLGGGTFDVSVMELTGNVFDVLGGGGDLYLGGVDFDNRIVDWVVRGFKEAHGVDLAEETVVKLRIRQAAEVAKRELSEKSEARIYLPYVAQQGDQGLNLDVTLTRETLNKLVQDLVDRTIEVCSRVLKDAGKTTDDIDEVLLVGGQTRMPLVQGRVHAFSGKAPRKGVHPDEAVAIGSALLGESLDKIDSVTLLDVLTVPIGVALPGGRFRPIIERNTKLPAERTITIATAKNKQKEMSIDIYQGSHPNIESNDYLGTLTLDLPSAPKGALEVSFNFQIDAQGFLTVTAEDSQSQGSRSIQMVTRDTPEDLEKLFEEDNDPLSSSSSPQ